jgi:hypothetical protein
MRYRLFLGALVALALSPFICSAQECCGRSVLAKPAQTFVVRVAKPTCTTAVPSCTATVDPGLPPTPPSEPSCEARAPRKLTCTDTVNPEAHCTCVVCKRRQPLLETAQAAKCAVACSVCAVANKAHCALTHLHDASCRTRCAITNALDERRASRCCCECCKADHAPTCTSTVRTNNPDCAAH